MKALFIHEAIALVTTLEVLKNWKVHLTSDGIFFNPMITLSKPKAYVFLVQCTYLQFGVSWHLPKTN